MSPTAFGDQRVIDLERNEEHFTSLSILASVQIPAETARVLYALAIPEYMEAWLHIPDADRIECHSEQRSYDRFRIDLYCAGVLQQSIFASCLLSKPNRITYLWERDILSGSARSVVEMQLWGDCSRCTLKLKHAGLRTHTEKEWHSAMWSCSLQKLRRLMEGIASRP